MNKPIHTVTIALTVVLLMFSVGCGSNSSNRPTFTQMGFYSNRAVTPATNLFLMNLDGSAATPVPTATGGLYTPSVDANLKTIVYTLAENVWTSNIDGSSQTELTTTGTSYSARLSPDGKKIVFNQYSDRSNLWIMNVDGTQPLNLSSTLPTAMTNCYSGSFSSDSTKIVMSCEGETTAGIFIIKPDGTGLTPVTTSSTFLDTPAFTPDGTKILFIQYGDSTGLFSVNADGSGQTSLNLSGYECAIFNAMVYYTVYDDNLSNYRIYRANLDGTGATAITDGAESDYLATSTDKGKGCRRVPGLLHRCLRTETHPLCDSWLELRR